VSVDTALTWGVALSLLGISIGAEGGLRLDRTTWTEVVMMLVGAGLVACALLRHRAGAPLRGGLTLLGLAALAFYTALSITWSVSPSDSWLEANRTFAYVATFAASLALVRLMPGRWAAVLGGVGLGCVLVCGLAVLTKVFPETFAPDETYARLREPFGYWNAVGLMAALGFPALLWLAARRSGRPAANALAWPGLGLLSVCLMLSYSRGALIALALGLALWFAIVPLRLRAVTALFAAAFVAAPVVAWAFARDALSVELIPLDARENAGHALGALLLLLMAVLLAAGLVVNFVSAQRPPSARTRRLAGRGLLALLALMPVLVLVAIAASPGGLQGQTRAGWDKLTNPNVATPANTPNRLTATSSVRARYWREALDIFQASPVIGEGAGGFVVARTRYRTDRLTARHAHGYVMQTLADLGLIGLGLSLLVALAWVVPAARATGLRRRDRGLPYDPERVGLLTMTSIVVIFTIHSLIDWTWFVPGNAAVALLCAGWVAGRPALRDRLSAPRVPEAPARVREGPRMARLRAWRPVSSAAAAGALAVLIAALAASWAAVQPVRAAHSEDAVLDALALQDDQTAIAKAREAEARNPLSLEPIWQLAFVQDAHGDKAAAARTLERAAASQPANAEAWRRLGRYRISVLKDPASALKAFRAAYFLDPASPRSASDLVEATRAQHIE
jgi:O-antigen ligase